MAKRISHPTPKAAPEEPAFHVALSFAGEDRAYVEKTADVLRRMGLRVFYDKYEHVSLWGKNLYDHLSHIYGKMSRYTVMFISKHYAKKLWTNHERQSAQAKAFSEKSEYILPVRFDDTEIPGIHATVGYIDLAHVPPRELAELIKEKIGHLIRENFMPENPDRLLALFGATTATKKRQLTSIAQGVFNDLCLMTPEERRLVSLVAVNTCPTGPEVDGDVHINIDLLARLSGLTRREIIGTFSRLECLSFAYELTSHEENNEPKNILRLTYNPLRVEDELSGNWTSVVYAMLSFIEENLCPECRLLALDHMDFSALSTLAGITDSHVQAPAAAKARSEQPRRVALKNRTVRSPKKR